MKLKRIVLAVTLMNGVGCCLASKKVFDEQYSLNIRLEMAKEIAKGLTITSGSNVESSFRPRSEARALQSVKKPKFRRAQASEVESTEESCDAAFAKCILSEKCESCFWKMQEDGINWASVNAETPCTDIVNLLSESGRCEDLKYDTEANDHFCNTFNNCVVFEDGTLEGEDHDGEHEGHPEESGVDCESLTSCDWKFIHNGFIGDGICHDKVPGCYNTAACGYDGGDCCEDTCKDHGRIKCGMDGFHCRDPQSKMCDPTISTNCHTGTKFNSTSSASKALAPSTLPKEEVECKADETKYRLIQYDTWGDGWDSTMMTITPKDDPNKVIYSGGLEGGSRGQDFICLASDPRCYSVSLVGGMWGVEVSWEIRPMGEGSLPVANGGAPMNCEFPVAGDTCDNTCDGKPDDVKPGDAQYVSFDDMLQCFEDKCMLPIGTCQKDAACFSCLGSLPAPYCYANKNFNSVLDCGVCSCTKRGATKGKAYCESKGISGTATKRESVKDEMGAVSACNRNQTQMGTNAVLKFARCSGVEIITSMTTKFDTSHFGAIDEFEECAHTYNNNEKHGGKKALECMRILSDTAGMPSIEGDDSTIVDPQNAPPEAISILARNLYENGETFCDCAVEASEACPMCKSFLNFKTLLYETADACKALDEIDCPAWKEYYGYCKEKLAGAFGVVDLDNEHQCKFIKEGCNGENEPPKYPFPAFRRLDCKLELPKAPWDFYEEYRKKCLGSYIPDPSSSSSSSKLAPSPTPSSGTSPGSSSSSAKIPPANTQATKKAYVPPPDIKPSSSASKNEKKAYIPPDKTSSSTAKNEKKKYVPPPDESPSSSSSSSSSSYVPPEERTEEKKKSKKRGFGFVKFLFFFAVCGAGYWYYKKRSDSFDFIRYRRQRDYSGGESELYGGLTMESGASSFEPPSLPPTPSSLA